MRPVLLLVAALAAMLAASAAAQDAPRDAAVALMVVTRGTDGRWLGGWTWPVAPAGRETCFGSVYLEGYALPRPRRARARGDQTCITL